MNESDFERFVTFIWGNENLSFGRKWDMLLGAATFAGQGGLSERCRDLFFLASLAKTRAEGGE